MEVLTTNSPNNEVLYTHAELITSEDKIDRDGMIEYCKNNKLIWLALPQIGISKSGFVAYFFNKWNIIINPVIWKRFGIDIPSEEACASLPWEKFIVSRSHSIMAKYNDRYHFITYPASIVFQHEYDHLNGILLDSKSKTWT